MKKLDVYILMQFLKTFFFSMLLFTLIAVAVDASEKAEDFIKTGFSLSEIITKYYYGFIPHIISLLFPVFVLISVVFFTSRLALRSEIIAMLSTGMSLRRLLFPYWIGGSILALMLGLANHFLVPAANKIRTDFENQHINMGRVSTQSLQYLTNLHIRIDSVSYAGIRSFDLSSGLGQGFFMEKMQQHKIVYNLRGEQIIWDQAKKEWRIRQVIERKINGVKETVQFKDSMKIVLGYLPTDLVNDEYMKEKLGTPALDRLIRQEKRRGSEGLAALQFERYRRDAYAISVIIMTLIAAILAARKIRGGSGLHLAFAFIIGVAFILTDKFSMVFSTKGNFPPLIAAWLPCLVFSGVAFYLYRKAPK
jgi:lipopolysaccharide export system permease protein